MDKARSEETPVIVVVEEETHERVFIADHLAEAGFEVLQADSSDAALALLEKRDDVRGVVTDPHVPGRIDGGELARLVRERWPEMAVVMMSGHSDESSGPLPEGSEFVAKPHLVSRLVPALHTLLGRAA